jgi:two-component system cell cycle response regulator
MKILVAEDDLVTRRILEAFLEKWGYEALIVGDGREAWQLLQRDDAPRLAILDWMMPGLDGTSICRQVRQLNLQPYIYLILLTARGFKQDMIEGLEAGADEYLTKPFDPYELKARLRSGARIVELQDSLIQARDALREQAMHDALTKLLNRRATLDFLISEMSRAKREHNPLTVMMIDIDHFKLVNDSLGHLTGDAVLSEVARRLRTSARTYDLVGRFGGEEFLIVAPACSAADGLAQAERLREVVCSEPIKVKDESVKVTISLGVATTLESVPQDMEALLAAADRALYRAKAAGRNRVEGEPSLLPVAESSPRPGSE